MNRPDPPAGDALTVEAVYDEHFAFVWRTLRALGVSEHQVEDALQDVFVVVHRRLAGFEGRSTLRSWLFAICRHTAQAYRRRAHRAHRDTAELPDEVPDPRAPSPRAGAEHAEAVALLAALLDTLDDDKRAVFVLIELEQLSAPEAAAALGINLNTVYSRLRAARRLFERAAQRRLAAGPGRES